ncbi:uncharacterized protein LOC143549290 [Bidens hawaiensis]|uniref:uncharacterized protein LOC143549290 n=1 Tax=Bidens hawaiensis TaxID=980011 RepID=UPI00404B3E0B
MHRQSLSSPASKHAVIFSGDGVITTDIDKNFASDDLRKDKLSSCSAVGAADEHRKRHVLVSSSTRLVHLIPVLTFVCFLILYLSSHDPSRTDLAQFSGFATISSKKTVIDSIDMDDNIGGGFLKNNALAIRSTRNLQQEEEEAERHRFRLHRKLGQ